MTTVHDLVGVGIGPFNLSLAALGDRVPGFDAVFLDENSEFSWHPGLLIEGTTLQVPFLADLVTMTDPTSPWSFLAYLKAHDRLFPFYFAEDFHIPRSEYSHYCRWVAENLPSCRFGTRVAAVGWNAAHEAFEVEYEHVRTARRERLLARDVVLGVGTAPVVPSAFDEVAGKEVFHASSYLDKRESLREAEDITVIGSGQSGAEVFLDLLRRQEETGWNLRWLTRSPAFAPMEYSKLGLEHFTPDYTEYFHGLDQSTKDSLVPRQWQLYKASSADVLAEIHDCLYRRNIGGARTGAELMPNVAVTGARRDRDGISLSCHQVEQDRGFPVTTDRVVLATGYAAEQPDCLDPLDGLIDRDEHGRYQVSADYRVALDSSVGGRLYVQNAEMHTHGVGAPDLGLGAHRAARILNSLTGSEIYQLPRTTSFTTFGADPQRGGP
ncbi:SidA/IucD/PvdA family monooxygenase [Saccharopolyspora sp. HNM0983]|uniref:L-lysine N6-monooxygenase MbtG n=1 Tax=Saccharopolyspora montiporae TaxID=2781240 RepID=A0A929B7Y9_9PSEU|nr:SidA/IucD/PvdA family monooxygenase [Saccharopolyspora sp. HNM0983]MBE9373495.1 SidA/IucD/PvdA family monooxygenase [Saccharopolyspora sp. HNM0983]